MSWPIQPTFVARPPATKYPTSVCPTRLASRCKANRQFLYRSTAGRPASATSDSRWLLTEAERLLEEQMRLLEAEKRESLSIAQQCTARSKRLMARLENLKDYRARVNPPTWTSSTANGAPVAPGPDDTGHWALRSDRSRYGTATAAGAATAENNIPVAGTGSNARMTGSPSSAEQPGARELGTRQRHPVSDGALDPNPLGVASDRSAGQEEAQTRRLVLQALRRNTSRGENNLALAEKLHQYIGLLGGELVRVRRGDVALAAKVVDKHTAHTTVAAAEAPVAAAPAAASGSGGALPPPSLAGPAPVQTPTIAGVSEPPKGSSLSDDAVDNAKGGRIAGDGYSSITGDVMKASSGAIASGSGISGSTASDVGVAAAAADVAASRTAAAADLGLSLDVARNLARDSEDARSSLMGLLSPAGALPGPLQLTGLVAGRRELLPNDGASSGAAGGPPGSGAAGGPPGSGSDRGVDPEENGGGSGSSSSGVKTSGTGGEGGGGPPPPPPSRRKGGLYSLAWEQVPARVVRIQMPSAAAAAARAAAAAAAASAAAAAAAECASGRDLQPGGGSGDGATAREMRVLTVLLRCMVLELRRRGYLGCDEQMDLVAAQLERALASARVEAAAAAAATATAAATAAAAKGRRGR
ncbi:hypothetical protein VOLCADRAFT_100907 [Volvox carteri f. nagariensis]|uniref:Uncharacterized protein n=1 Tax=Volvox carteri f. nagariensis TaxID=3068 RepID=D8ULB5_VOLCA|nr:uncharacterized protein VOLCADRAFT_100907 [Volvox carteri f. nagariensis]EFJ39485.1 hypothetical protein VOLCADRAFT_100907 [Volvox carteri f. nagariensis]|eukprot:XP_002959451.1 hypothetical protein VOLCADRAFT_100907 [Volvox carteri f. nagariensis]